MKNLTLCLGVVVLGIGTGCGMVKNLDEMHDSTVNMSGTTKEMAKTTDEMARITTEMKELIGNTYADMRIASAREARQQAQLGGMEKADDIGPKLSFSSEFYASQEFHFWKPTLETEEDRLEMMELAVKDYFYKIRGYMRDRNDTNIPIIQDNASENLFAISAMMHFVNPVQTKLLKKYADKGMKEVTMYSMIEDGLRAKEKLLKGEITEDQLPGYQKQVLIFEQDAIYMLQIRQNFLKAFAYCLMSNTDVGNQLLEVHSMKDFAKLKNIKGLLKVGSTLLFGKSWVPNFKDRTAPQINLDAEIIEYAAKAMELLTDVGYLPAKDKKFDKLYSKIDFKETYRQAESSPRLADQLYMQSVKRVEVAVKRVLK